MADDYSLIVSLEREFRIKSLKGGAVYCNSNAFGTDNFYGELVVFYCKKKKGLFGKETLKTLKSYSKKYHIDAVENGTEAKTKLKELIK